MIRVRVALSVALMLVVFSAGCTVAKVRVRQDDGTYRTYNELTWSSSWKMDLKNFECHEDHMVATTVMGVTYGWPKGEGSYQAMDRVIFKSETLTCEVKQRTLTINGNEVGTYEEGDTVVVNADGTVIVNP